MSRRAHVIVRGRVQGVFFRQSLEDLAHREGVAGWVRNRSDGALEAVFEGDPEAVERLIAFCGEGPPRARVEGVERLPEEPPEGLCDFSVA